MTSKKSDVKRVLVSGATGFVGRASLQPLLDRGYEVHAVSRGDFPLHPTGITWHKGDMLDRTFVKDLVGSLSPSHLLTFAWHMVPGDTYPSLENFRWVEAGIHLLRQFGRQGGRRVVMAGSGTEYDWSAGMCNEKSTPLASKSQYSSAKQALYMAFGSMCERMDVSGAWGRLFFVYGPHEQDHRLASSLILSLLRDEPAKCSSGEFARDYIHVEDAARAYVALLDSDVTGAVNIGTGEAVRICDLAMMIGEKMQKKDLVHIGALPTRGAEPPLVCADINRLSREVGWQPRFSIDSGLNDTIAWWREKQGQGALISNG